MIWPPFKENAAVFDRFDKKRNKIQAPIREGFLWRFEHKHFFLLSEISWRFHTQCFVAEYFEIVVARLVSP